MSKNNFGVNSSSVKNNHKNVGSKAVIATKVSNTSIKEPITLNIVLVLGLNTSSIHELGAMLSDETENLIHLDGSFPSLTSTDLGKEMCDYSLSVLVSIFMKGKVPVFSTTGEVLFSQIKERTFYLREYLLNTLGATLNITTVFLSDVDTVSFIEKPLPEKLGDIAFPNNQIRLSVYNSDYLFVVPSCTPVLLPALIELCSSFMNPSIEIGNFGQERLLLKVVNEQRDFITFAHFTQRFGSFQAPGLPEFTRRMITCNLFTIKRDDSTIILAIPTQDFPGKTLNSHVTVLNENHVNVLMKELTEAIFDEKESILLRHKDKTRSPILYDLSDVKVQQGFLDLICFFYI